ncbi:karyopherin [Friedmanniomyces endolithicus]|uniref:Karyopherin n=1 Tax=Friedmanniomyces endolithicus TaxID=329885 RepID=A0AAN6JYY2_9PEZI|nr:karyopherin [Friedmanniomyces endolithicus]KAK0880600.1 karyopherin [Friedmanniomyces endolithicus]KAK0912758.1 karyopherin [Friedmanniomyces endolithicus]KAK0956910.1 karyopherin [Friedmanniomyces endolithicus]KAK0986832.1 karyopherin [Friedmanniomyces endolithicus]
MESNDTLNDSYNSFPTFPDQHQLDTVRAALAATLNPRIPNEIRQQALHHLEELKHQPDAPHYGYTFASDAEQNDDALRYYGLQLLEFAVRYRWLEYAPAQTDQLRAWVLSLAGDLRDSDALFLRNKIGQLWVEVAKRCWGEEWMDMDELLLELWEKPMSETGVVNKVFVLYVLEMLSEDIVNNEDAVAGLRLETLGAALNEIMIPHGLYEEHARTRQATRQQQEVRCGDEGWLARVCGLFAECMKFVRMGGVPEEVQSMTACAVKALNALRPTMAWVSLKAAVEANCVDCLFLPFHTEDVALQTAATETLYVLLCRQYNAHWHDAWSHLQLQALRPDRVAMIRQTFERTASSTGDDEAAYTLQKKMAEILSLLADAVSQHPRLIEGGKLDLPMLFDLLLYVLQSKSHVVSIPVLHSWSKMMAVQDHTIIDMVLQALGTLIQTCSERLLRYELLPSESEDEVVRFLDEDFDTTPERHAFLGNYRRYCTGIIQAIARSRPMEAMQHVLEQMRSLLHNGPYTSDRGFETEAYSRNSMPVLQFDAQFNVVSSALKGFSLWCLDVAVLGQEEPLYAKAQADRASAGQSLQEWSYGVISVQVDDPEIAAQVLQTLVLILRTVKPGPEFVLYVIQHLLTMRLDDNPAHTAFSDAVKGFEGLRVIELQKLALVFANELLEVYNELEPRVAELVQAHNDDQRLVWGYRSFLFMIIHRAKGLDRETRMARLQQMLEPVYEAWQDPDLTRSAGSLQTFCDSLALGDLGDFYKAYRFDQIQDWSAHQLDEAGQARQQMVKDRSDLIPLRMTKNMLAATTEKLKPSSEEFETASALWSGIIPVILPTLLQMLRHAQAFHNLNNWSHLPDELQAVIRRTLQDRFWQSGISNESKEDFYARISGSKTSYEGFASTVRGTMRNIREQGYQIIYLMTKFDEQFYSTESLAVPLAEALFADAEALSANHLHPIINLATGLVSRCPPHYREGFLPPLLKELFTKLDAKISQEWEAIGAAHDRNASEADELGDEMRVESVLRQLTFSMVSFVPFLLEYDRQQQQPTPPLRNGTAATNGSSHHHHAPARHPTLSEIVLSDPSVLEPLMLFCTHALRMRDTRCCTIICKAFRTIIPLFQAPTTPNPTSPPTISSFNNNNDNAAQVREFISTAVLQSCITSLHDPYFADMQKDLASLIAHVILLYSPSTDTPREVLCSLPDMTVARVEKAFARIGKAGGSERVLRAVVLELLEGVRGVGIYEAGRIGVAGIGAGGGEAGKRGVRREYMEVETGPARVGEGEEVGLEGVAGLFGEV